MHSRTGVLLADDGQEASSVDLTLEGQGETADTFGKQQRYFLQKLIDLIKAGLTTDYTFALINQWRQGAWGPLHQIQRDGRKVVRRARLRC